MSVVSCRLSVVRVQSRADFCADRLLSWDDDSLIPFSLCPLCPLSLLIQEVDHLSEAALVVSVEFAEESWEVGDVGFVGFDFVGGSCVETAVAGDVGEVGFEVFELSVGGFVLESDDGGIAVVAHGVVVAIKAADLIDGGVDVVGDFVEAEVGGADEFAAEELLVDVLLPLDPEASALFVDEDDGHGDGFSGLDEGEDFEEFVHGSETAWEGGHGVAGADEHEFSGEEVFEVDEFFIAVDVAVGGLFEGESDGESEAGVASRAAVRCGHDASACAGGDHPASFGHASAEFDGGLVVGFGFGCSCGAEDADFSSIAVGCKDFERVAEFRHGGSDEFEVAAVGFVAKKFDRSLDDVGDLVSFLHFAQHGDEFL